MEDGLLLHHLGRLGDREIRLRVLHVEARSRRQLLLRLPRLLRIRHLHWSRLLLLSLLWLGRVRGQPGSNAGGALARICCSIWYQRSGVSIAYVVFFSRTMPKPEGVG